MWTMLLVTDSSLEHYLQGFLYLIGNHRLAKLLLWPKWTKQSWNPRPHGCLEKESFWGPTLHPGSWKQDHMPIVISKSWDFWAILNLIIGNMGKIYIIGLRTIPYYIENILGSLYFQFILLILGKQKFWSSMFYDQIPKYFFLYDHRQFISY